MIPTLLLALTLQAPALEKPFFNGKDLDGWVNVNCAPKTFFVKDGEAVTTGSPTGYLRTTKQYENFTVEFEWMHTRKDGQVANSGFFVWADALPAVGTGYTRGIEVQVLCNLEYRDKKTNAVTATSHGDLFSIWGATCKPDRPHPSAGPAACRARTAAKGCGEWNHYKVTANDGTIKLEVNGKEVSGVSECKPRKGYLALESEGSECHFRNFNMKELPSTNPKPEECAKLDAGHVSLFDGLTLDGWETGSDSWKANDGVLKCAKVSELKLAKKLPKGELLFDYRVPKSAEKTVKSFVVVGGRTTELTAKSGWTRLTIPVEDDAVVFFAPAKGLELRSIFAK